MVTPSIFYKHFACLPHLLSCHPHAACFDSTVFLPLHSGCIWSSFYSFRKFSLFFILSYIYSGFWFPSGVKMWSIRWKGQTAGCLFLVDMWRFSVLSKPVLVSSGTFIQNVMEGWSLLICTFRVWSQGSCSHGGFFQWASPGPDCSSCHQMHPPSFCVLCCPATITPQQRSWLSWLLYTFLSLSIHCLFIPKAMSHLLISSSISLLQRFHLDPPHTSFPHYLFLNAHCLRTCWVWMQRDSFYKMKWDLVDHLLISIQFLPISTYSLCLLHLFNLYLE